MLDVNGKNLENSPFENLELINELLDFEGRPILLHYIDERKNDILSYWVDFDNTGNRWLYCKVTKQELFDYLIGIKSLKDLFSKIISDYIFLIDKGNNNQDSAIKLINSYSLPDLYFPKEESYYTYGLSEFYQEYLSDNFYI